MSRNAIMRTMAALIALATSATLAAEWRRESPRRASASVSQTNGLWNISVQFVPVTSFEENKNLLENHRMAQSIAEWGLLKELNAKPTQTLETTGVEKTAFSVRKDFVFADFSIPTGGVCLVEKKVPAVKDIGEAPERPSLPPWPDTVADIKICDGETEAILRRHPFFMETGGAKILRLEDGKALIVAIGMTDAAKSPVARRTIAESKARAALVSQVNGIKVFTEKRLDEKNVTKISEKGEAAFEISESTERIRSISAGKIQGLGTVGTWVLKDENQFCLAIGRVIAAGEVEEFISSVQ